MSKGNTKKEQGENTLPKQRKQLRKQRVRQMIVSLIGIAVLQRIHQIRRYLRVQECALPLFLHGHPMGCQTFQFFL